MAKLFAVVALLFLVACETESKTDAPMPPGWRLFSANVPTQSELQCGNWSRREWKIAASGDAIAIVEQETARSRPNQTISFRDGWLVGRDDGEWGGDLLWLNREKTRTTELAKENVVGFIETDYATLVLVGLDHMGLDRGKVLSVSRNGPLPPTATVYAELGATPYAFTKDHSGEIIVVTRTKVVRLKRSGVVQTLLATNYGGLYPSSVAITPGGVIYVGMRHFVTRLTPTSASYHQDWLLPANCSSFRIQERDCRCVDRAKLLSGDLANWLGD